MVAIPVGNKGPLKDITRTEKQETMNTENSETWYKTPGTGDLLRLFK